jgi:transcriptional regulator with XRE-family HTH domain
MTYRPTDRTGGASEPPPSRTPAPSIDPTLWSRPEWGPVLAAHDLGALFRMLSQTGIGQRQIAALIGRSQSRVSDITHGRQVLAYDVLRAIATGLGVPPERMGLSWWGPDGRWYGPEGTYSGGVTVTDTPEGVIVAMLRRHLIAWGGIVMTGSPVAHLGELLAELPDSGRCPCPPSSTTPTWPRCGI